MIEKIDNEFSDLLKNEDFAFKDIVENNRSSGVKQQNYMVIITSYLPGSITDIGQRGGLHSKNEQ